MKILIGFKSDEIKDLIATQLKERNFEVEEFMGQITINNIKVFDYYHKSMTIMDNEDNGYTLYFDDITLFEIKQNN